MEDSLVCLQPRELETERGWSDIPLDLLRVILSQIFLLDRCNFKLVCKSWNLTRPVPQPLPPPVESPYFNSPCLMFSTPSNNSWTLFHSLYNQFYMLEFQELKDAEIYFSKYGWLLMSRDDELKSLFFFNPFTKEKIELPKTIDPFISVCFTNPPTSPDCTIVGIFKRDTIDIKFGLLKIGDKEWKSELFESIDGRCWNSTCPPLYCNGVYYCMQHKSREIGVFDPIDEDDWQWMQYTVYTETSSEEEEDEEEEDKEEEDDEEENKEEEEEEEEEEDAEEENKEEEDNEEEENKEEEEKEEVVHENYMAEVDGDIWSVFVIGETGQVRVQKLDSSEMRWIELETLGNKCLYVSPNGSFAETCTVNGIANTIYFNKFHGKSGVIYSLKSGMYHSVVGNFSSEEARYLTEFDFGAWIKPTM